MRKLFILATTTAGAWLLVRSALSWGAALVPEAVFTNGRSPAEGLFVIPALLLGALCGAAIGSILYPRRH